MKFTDKTIESAFDAFKSIYSPQRGWGLDDFFPAWKDSLTAFTSKAPADYEKVFRRLIAWQAFRGGVSHWESDRTLQTLMSIPSSLDTLRLSQLTVHEAQASWHTLVAIAPIKVNKNGPSLVAVSKVLHLWNPRLVVIVDDAFMWRWVLEHKWIWGSIVDFSERISSNLGSPITDHPDFHADLRWYFFIILWAAELVRDNPNIVSSFYSMVKSDPRASLVTPLSEYDAVACEWFLLGVVELPPGETGKLNRLEKKRRN